MQTYQVWGKQIVLSQTLKKYLQFLFRTGQLLLLSQSGTALGSGGVRPRGPLLPSPLLLPLTGQLFAALRLRELGCSVEIFLVKFVERDAIILRVVHGAETFVHDSGHDSRS